MVSLTNATMTNATMTNATMTNATVSKAAVLVGSRLSRMTAGCVTTMLAAALLVLPGCAPSDDEVIASELRGASNSQSLNGPTQATTGESGISQFNQRQSGVIVENNLGATQPRPTPWTATHDDDCSESNGKTGPAPATPGSKAPVPGGGQAGQGSAALSDLNRPVLPTPPSGGGDDNPLAH
jgi:hypothetical protein